MLNIQHILVPTDFSGPSENAVRYGRELAQTFAATLHLVHVIEDMPIYPWASPEGILPMPMPARDKLDEAVRAQLTKLVAGADSSKLKSQIAILSGTPFVEIIRYAKQQSIDLIVIGTHGRGPVAHMLMGSVAEKVVRKAPCPVLSVRESEHEFIMP